MLKQKMFAASAAALMLGGAGIAEARTQIRIVGSSTVYPFTTVVAEQFKRTYPQFPAPIVESTGTGGGMKLFCTGVGEQYPDFTNASRRIKASEVKQCAENGVTQIVEIQIGLDGLTVAESISGKFPGLTEREIYMALAANPFGKGANRYKTWNQINPKLPATKIEVIGPPPTSGTRDSLHELYLIKGCETEPSMVALKKSDDKKFQTICTKIREDGAYIEGGENDNLIVQKVSANPNALGIFGYSFLEENQNKIKGVPINGITPNNDTITSFKFPASRPLYFYAKAQHVRAVRGMREFLLEYTKESTWGPGGTLAKRGLVPSPKPVREKYAAVAKNLTPLAPGEIK